MARRPAPHPKLPPPSETSIHMAVEQFLRLAWPDDLPYTHFPAGEARDERTGGKLKRMGLKAGWPDFQFILPNGQSAFIELKRPGQSLSDAQIMFRAQALALKCGYAVAHSVDEAETVLAGWLALFGRKLRASTVQGRAA
jgi:hypothetical protein